MTSKRKKIWIFSLTAAGLLLLFWVGVNTGSLKVTPAELFKGLFVEYNSTVASIYDLRFPRILLRFWAALLSPFPACCCRR